MQSIEHQGKKLAYYRSGGKGPAVTLVHGFCEDASLWHEWLKRLPRRPGYLCIDLPGAGQSGRPGGLSIESMADAVAAVLAAEGVEKTVLVGHSMGGYVGLAFVEKYGEKLLGLCLFHSQPFADTAEKKAGRLKSVEFIERNGHGPFVRQLLPGLFAEGYPKSHPEVVDRLVSNALQCRPEAITAALHAMRQRPDRSAVLEKINCPVLFFIGKKDGAIPLENSLAQTHLPNIADIHIYPNVGHMGMFEAPGKTATAFRAFLKRMREEG